MAQNVRTVRTTEHPTRAGDDVVVGYEETTTLLPSRIKRISWGAIVAGVVIALVMQIALNLLGLSIGVNTINPATEAQPVDPALGTGAVIWIAASTLLSLFAGGWVAGYLSGLADDMAGVLHGLVVWGIVSLLTLFVLTNSVANIATGIINAMGTAVTGAAQGVAAVVQETGAVPELTEPGALQEIQTEIQGMLSQMTQPEAGDAGGAVETAPGDAAAPATTQDQSSQEITTALMQLVNQENVNRQDVVDLIASRTNMTQAEAEETLTRWESSIQQTRAQVTETVEEVAQGVTDAIAALAGILFAALVIGAFAAGAGGLVGSPDREEVAEAAVIP